MWVKVDVTSPNTYVNLDMTASLSVVFVDLAGTENDRYELRAGSSVIARYVTEQEALDALDNLAKQLGAIEIVGSFDL